ncbi:hypothetical protein SK128_001094 [Halocaridina rubra]|uniref:Uncharacterized protein n=1 Tax=Halocaridina rubra TaxID=373956 RepID=A0AAN8XFX6_HALRR
MKQETLRVTVSDPAGSLKKDEALSPDSQRSGSPLAFPKVGTVAKVGTLAKAFRKVFRSRTPSPSTEDKEDHFHHSGEARCDSSDYEGQDSFQIIMSPPPIPEDGQEQQHVFTMSSGCDSAFLSDDKEKDQARDLLCIHSPGVSKSQTYSALSEALHHAFLEGMVCSGAEDSFSGAQKPKVD